jgi:hypothetical protein
MSSDLRKIEVEQRLRLTLLRNRGVIRDTIEDYEREFGTRLPEHYVVRVYRKFRREISQDNLRWVSYHFAQEFIAQASKVQHQLAQQLREYNEKSIREVSVCCHAPVIDHPISDRPLCLKCDSQCEVIEEIDKEMERLKLKVIDRLQKEQDLTMRFLEGMGFLQRRNGPGILNVGVQSQQEYLPEAKSRAPKKPDGLDPELQDELDHLDPRDAQLMLDGDLELTVEFEDDKDANQRKEKTNE